MCDFKTRVGGLKGVLYLQDNLLRRTGKALLFRPSTKSSEMWSAPRLLPNEPHERELVRTVALLRETV